MSADPRLARLDSVRALPTSGYLLTWEDGFALTVGDDFGLRLLDDLSFAHNLRAQSEGTTRYFERMSAVLEGRTISSVRPGPTAGTTELTFKDGESYIVGAMPWNLVEARQ